MNIFSVISSASASLSLFLAVLLFLRRKSGGVILLLMASFLCSFLWSGLMVFFYTLDYKPARDIIYLLSRCCIFFLAALLLHALILMSRRISSLRITALMLIYTPAVTACVLNMTGQDSWIEYLRSPWGWVVQIRNGTLIPLLIVALLLAVSLLSMLIMLHWLRYSPYRMHKHIARVLLGISIPVFLLSAVSVISFQFLRLSAVPELTHVLGTIWLTGFWYVLSRLEFPDFFAHLYLRDILDASLEGMIFTNNMGDILYTNPRAAELLQMDIPQLQFRSIENFFTPGTDFPEHLFHDTEVYTPYRMDTSMISQDSQPIPVHLVITSLGKRGNAGRIFLFCIHDQRELEMLRDQMSRQKEQELALQISELQYRNVLDAVDDFLHVIDKNFRVILHNHPLEKYIRELGYQGEILGQDLFTLIPSLSEIQKEEYRRIFQTGQVMVTQESRFLNGREQQFEVRKIPVKENGTTVNVLTVVHNLKNRIKLEEIQLRQDKLEALAVLAGGIAHDFNNILTGILGNISIAGYKSTQPEIISILKRAEEAAYRAKNLTSQLLTFSKGSSPQRSTLSVTRSLEETAHFILSGSSITLVTEFSHTNDLVDFNESQLQRVFHNLLLNAREAMQQSGTLTLHTENLSLTSPHPALALSPGEYILIQIQDQGMGINTNILHHIFDPFFTTKTQSTGLGLSTAFSIIRDHGGLIDVDSRPGEGSTFSIYLPLSRRMGETISAPLSPQGQGQGRILVMDDEEMVRTASRVILEFLGYEVVLCCTGSEALQQFETSAQQGKGFDIALLDMTIPQGSGALDIIDELRSIYPHTRYILCSGYSELDLTELGRKRFAATLSKPFDVNKLGECIQQVMLKQG